MEWGDKNEKKSLILIVQLFLCVPLDFEVCTHYLFKNGYRDFMEVQWLRLLTVNTEGLGSIPGQGTMIPHAAGHDQQIFKMDTNVFKGTELMDMPLLADLITSISMKIVAHIN